MSQFQVTFSDQSMRLLNSLPILVQLPLVERFGSLTEHDLQRGAEGLGKFVRDGRIYYRLRAEDYRIYFDRQEDILHSYYILHRHTLADFIFRMKMPYKEESMLEQDQSFWKYLEQLTRD